MQKYKLVCRCCGEVLRKRLCASQSMLAFEISERHQNFKNAYVDNRCKQRASRKKFAMPFEFVDLTPEEIARDEHTDYMNNANL